MGRERGGFRGRRRGPRPPRGRRPSRPTEFSQRLDSDADRLSLLTGEADPIKSPDSSRLLREDYDPVDRKFNRQFDESPRGRQPWDSDPRGNPLERDPLKGYDNRGGRDISRPTGRGLGSLGNVPPRVDSRPPRTRQYWEGGRKWETQPAQSWDYGGDLRGSIPEGRTDITPTKKENRYRGTAGTGPTSGAIDTGRKYYSNQDLKDMRGDPVSGVELERRKMFNEPLHQEKYDDSSIKQRLRDLENRKPQITPATQDLSGITGRLSELEGRQSSWQEDRIKSLEERKPDTSWKDPLSTLQTGQRQGQEARTALDQRLASLENYYKNDPPPPPEESTGNRYEDKQAQLNKMWEQTGNVYDPEAFNPDNPWGYKKEDRPSWLTGDRKGDYVRNKDFINEAQWADKLPETYRKQMRDLDREYNKPSHSAIIKGREYTAYGPSAAARLKYLDRENIHEDEYLGHGSWENKFGEEITGRGRSNQKRYFASHSGLDRESEEYAKRFRRSGGYEKDGELTNYYKQHQAGTMSEGNKHYWDAIGGYKPEEHGKYGWGVVGTNRSKTGQTRWDEAYYPELG